MAFVAVHAAGAGQPGKMRGAAGFLHLFNEVQQGGAGGEAAVLDREVDLAKVHRHHPAGADIGVPDLGIAHLAGGQADIAAMGDEGGVRAGCHEPVEIGRIGQERRVAGAVRGQPPAVEDAKDYGFGGGHDRHPFETSPRVLGGERGSGQPCRAATPMAQKQGVPAVHPTCTPGVQTGRKVGERAGAARLRRVSSPERRLDARRCERRFGARSRLWCTSRDGQPVRAVWQSRGASGAIRAVRSAPMSTRHPLGLGQRSPIDSARGTRRRAQVRAFGRRAIRAACRPGGATMIPGRSGSRLLKRRAAPSRSVTRAPASAAIRLPAAMSHSQQP